MVYLSCPNSSVRDTSLNAYIEYTDDGLADSKRAEVYKLLKKYQSGLTRNEISQISGMRINSVCGRVNELIRLGMAYEDGKEIDKITKKENYIVKCIIREGIQ